MNIKLGDILEVTHTEEVLIIAPIGNNRFILMRTDGMGYHSIYDSFEKLEKTVIEFIQKDIFIRYPGDKYKLNINKVIATTKP